MFSSKLASHSSPIARRALKTALLGATALMLVCAPAMVKTGCESSGAFCGFDQLAPSAGPLEPGQHNDHNGVGSQHGRQSGSHHQGGGEGSSGGNQSGGSSGGNGDQGGSNGDGGQGGSSGDSNGG